MVLVGERVKFFGLGVVERVFSWNAVEGGEEKAASMSLENRVFGFAATCFGKGNEDNDDAAASVGTKSS